MVENNGMLLIAIVALVAVIGILGLLALNAGQTATTAILASMGSASSGKADNTPCARECTKLCIPGASLPISNVGTLSVDDCVTQCLQARCNQNVRSGLCSAYAPADGCCNAFATQDPDCAPPDNSCAQLAICFGFESAGIPMNDASNLCGNMDGTTCDALTCTTAANSCCGSGTCN